MKNRLKCPQHPKYSGKKPPKDGCSACQSLYYEPQWRCLNDAYAGMSKLKEHYAHAVVTHLVKHFNVVNPIERRVILALAEDVGLSVAVELSRLEYTIRKKLRKEK